MRSARQGCRPRSPTPAGTGGGAGESGPSTLWRQFPGRGRRLQSGRACAGTGREKTATLDVFAVRQTGCSQAGNRQNLARRTRSPGRRGARVVQGKHRCRGGSRGQRKPARANRPQPDPPLSASGDAITFFCTAQKLGCPRLWQHL